MTWVRIDDRFPTHRKAIAAGPLGRDLFVCGLAYCNLHLTDGEIPVGAISTIAPGQKRPLTIANVLVSVGLWERTESGFRVHDYSDWNRTREDVAELSELKRQAGRVGGQRSGEARRKQRASEADQAYSKRRALGASNPSPTPIPPISPPNVDEAPASNGGRPPGLPPEAFNDDCPTASPHGYCLSRPWMLERYPGRSTARLKQCAYHRGEADQPREERT